MHAPTFSLVHDCDDEPVTCDQQSAGRSRAEEAGSLTIDYASSASALGANQQTPAVVCTACAACTAAPKKRRPAGDTRSISAQGTLAGGSLHPTQRRPAQHNTAHHHIRKHSGMVPSQPRPLKMPPANGHRVAPKRTGRRTGGSVRLCHG